MPCRKKWRLLCIECFSQTLNEREGSRGTKPKGSHQKWGRSDPQKKKSSELELFKSDSFTILSDLCDRQAEELKNLQARLLDMEAQLGATYSSTPGIHALSPKRDRKNVKCHDCQLIFSVDSFSSSQVRKRKGRKCNSCLRQTLAVSDLAATSRDIKGSPCASPAPDVSRNLAGSASSLAASASASAASASTSASASSSASACAYAPESAAASSAGMEAQPDSNSTSFLSSSSSNIVATHTSSLQHSFIRAGLVEKKQNPKKYSRKDRAKESVRLLISSPQAPSAS